MKRLLLGSILLLLFIFGRQNWTLVTNQVEVRTTTLAIEFEEATARQAAAPSEAVRAEIRRLRPLAWTCPLLLKCSPRSAVRALHFLDLEDQRFVTFEQAAVLTLQIEAAPELSGDADVAEFDFRATVVAYHKLLYEIDAAKAGVPAEIVSALAPLS
jgi:hypothetical protein